MITSRKDYGYHLPVHLFIIDECTLHKKIVLYYMFGGNNFVHAGMDEEVIVTVECSMLL
jgi:hypothetical protein